MPCEIVNHTAQCRSVFHPNYSCWRGGGVFNGSLMAKGGKREEVDKARFERQLW